jgi:expansin (peptidoglycan-binding protein)
MSGQTFDGDATYYNLMGAYTACGTQHNDDELVCALNSQQFDPETPGGNPNNNKLCGRKVRVTGPKGTAEVTVVDRLPSGKYGDLDLSPAAFKLVAGDLGLGRVRVQWQFV